MIEVLNRLDASGDLQLLLEAGLISSKVVIYREVFLYVDAIKKTRKLDHVEAVKLTADKFKVSCDTVYRAIRILS